LNKVKRVLKNKLQGCFGNMIILDKEFDVNIRKKHWILIRKYLKNLKLKNTGNF